PLPAKPSPLKPVTHALPQEEERQWHSEIVHGRASLKAYRHPAPYRVPVLVLHFRSHFPELLDLYTHFVEHAAASLGVPITGTARLPTQRSLWTVIRGPFVHKKSQENFHRLVHKRAIRAFDTHPEVSNKFVMYLQRHAIEGVGMRVVSWQRVPVGVGRQLIENVASHLRLGEVPVAEQIQQLGQQIVAEEM
ncbi:ribosomal protein S10 domain-containing protein, partial [Vararia minispora EC-137]